MIATKAASDLINTSCFLNIGLALQNISRGTKPASIRPGVTQSTPTRSTTVGGTVVQSSDNRRARVDIFVTIVRLLVGASVKRNDKYDREDDDDNDDRSMLFDS